MAPRLLPLNPLMPNEKHICLSLKVSFSFECLVHAISGALLRIISSPADGWVGAQLVGPQYQDQQGYVPLSHLEVAINTVLTSTLHHSLAQLASQLPPLLNHQPSKQNNQMNPPTLTQV